jgi:hypothetical protein
MATALLGQSHEPLRSILLAGNAEVTYWDPTSSHPIHPPLGGSPDYVGQAVAATGDCGWRYRLCAILFFYLNRPKAGESCHACRFL